MAPSAAPNYFVEPRISSTTFSFSHVPPVGLGTGESAGSSASDDDFDFIAQTPPSRVHSNSGTSMRQASSFSIATPRHRRHIITNKQEEEPKLSLWTKVCQPPERPRIVCSVLAMVVTGFVLLTAILLVTLSAVVKLKYTSERCKQLQEQANPRLLLSDGTQVWGHRNLQGVDAADPDTQVQLLIAQEQYQQGVYRSRGWNVTNWNRNVRLNHFRVLGTHNSYHLDSSSALGSHLYSHAPLYDQLGIYEKGVRQIELDIHLVDDTYVVYHLQLVDDHTSCYCLAECLGHVRKWSNDNPYHFPISIFFEIKAKLWEDVNTGLSGVSDKHVTALDQHIRDAFPLDRVITPDEVLGNYDSFADALMSNTNGWPPLKESLGKFLFVWLDTTDLASNVRSITSDASMRDHLFFMGSSDLSLPYVTLAVIGDPRSMSYDSQMTRARARRLLIRSIADNSDGYADAERFQLVLQASPNYITTDFDCTTPAQDTSPNTAVPTSAPTHTLSPDDNTTASIGHKEYCEFLPTTRPFECNPMSCPKECYDIAFFQPV